jgi:serine/threonine kinase 32
MVARLPRRIHSSSASTKRFQSDLKPDNILLDGKGHAHLTDFNLAVHYSDDRLLTNHVGSMAYMGTSFSVSLVGEIIYFTAPEALVKKSYNYTIDWWSLGICAYELLFGRRPFCGGTNCDLIKSITQDPLKFPEDRGKQCSRDSLLCLKEVSRATNDQNFTNNSFVLPLVIG